MFLLPLAPQPLNKLFSGVSAPYSFNFFNFSHSFHHDLNEILCTNYSRIITKFIH